MDNDDLIEAGESSPLPGLAPLVEQAIQQALKDQAAGAAAAVVADRLAEQDLDELAHRALERELLDLAEPAGPYLLADIENGDGGVTEDGDEGWRTTKRPKPGVANEKTN
jgi:hypothetical protein